MTHNYSETWVKHLIHEINLNKSLHTNLVRTSQETHHVSATETNWLILFTETVAVYCVMHAEHTNTLCERNAEFQCSVRTSQETQHASVTKSNRLRLFKETVVIYCENHTEHTNNTLWAECRVLVCSVRTSQETHHASVTKSNRLMLFKETVAVYCENHTEQRHFVVRMQNFSM
jgi:hypothetical protein